MDELLHIIKNRLNITWNYDDVEIRDLIDEGTSVIESFVGEIDFLQNKKALRLLKEYCRYSWNGASNFFMHDYKSDILNLQISKSVKDIKND